MASGTGSGHINPFPKRRKSLQTTILNLMKMAERFSKRLEKMMGRYEQFLLFTQCLLKACTRKDFNYNIGVAGQTNIMYTHLSLFTEDVLKTKSMFSLFIPYFGEDTEH